MMGPKEREVWYTVLVSFECIESKPPRSKPIFEIPAMLGRADTGRVGMRKG